jgi:hypothetical protein
MFINDPYAIYKFLTQPKGVVMAKVIRKKKKKKVQPEEPVETKVQETPENESMIEMAPDLSITKDDLMECDYHTIMDYAQGQMELMASEWEKAKTVEAAGKRMRKYTTLLDLINKVLRKKSVEHFKQLAEERKAAKQASEKKSSKKKDTKKKDTKKASKKKSEKTETKSSAKKSKKATKKKSKEA